MTFAVPVPDEAGATTAILAGTVRLDLPVGVYATLQVSPDDSVVIDRAGQVVVDRGVVTLPAPADPSFLSAVRDGAGSSEPVVGPDGSGSFVAGYAPIGSSGWRAVVLVDATAAMAPAALGLAFDLATLGLLAVLGVLVAIWAGRRLDRAADQEQREADRLRTREAFLRRFADALPVVAGTLDESLHTTFANEALRARTGSDLVAAIHPDDVSLLPRGTGATGPDRITMDLRLRDDRADGFRWHRASFLEATDVPGVRWFFAAADIDDEKLAELGLKRDIQQRDEFLGLVSHELRTPMSVIVGNAVRLERRYREQLPDDAIEGLRDIEQSTWQLQRVLENMLVLAKSVAGDAGSDVEPVVLSRLMERTIAEFQVRFPDAVTRTEIDPELPIVAANETFVDQVLWNLLTNAAKYGARGRPITASARAVGAFVEVAVRDDGPGIPQDELELIFEPHYRSRSVRARADGLGLGLSVCRRLVELQGGSIAAERLAGSGTRIVFTIPVIEMEPLTGISGTVPSKGEPEAAAQHGSPAPAV
jgi:signal transduction histidine kinase